MYSSGLLPGLVHVEPVPTTVQTKPDGQATCPVPRPSATHVPVRRNAKFRKARKPAALPVRLVSASELKEECEALAPAGSHLLVLELFCGAGKVAKLASHSGMEPAVGVAHFQYECRGQDLLGAWQQLPGRVPRRGQGLEQPANSMTWQIPELLAFRRSVMPSSGKLEVDYCRFGKAFKKPTMVWFLGTLSVLPKLLTCFFLTFFFFFLLLLL
eukprot:s2541_g23.t1